MKYNSFKNYVDGYYKRDNKLKKNTLLFVLSIIAVLIFATFIPCMADSENTLQDIDPFAETDEESGDETLTKKDISDPLESYNRVIFTINDKFYTYGLKPVAKGYNFIFPLPY